MSINVLLQHLYRLPKSPGTLGTNPGLLLCYVRDGPLDARTLQTCPMFMRKTQIRQATHFMCTGVRIEMGILTHTLRYFPA